MAAEALEVLDQVYQALNAHDAAAVGRLCSEDIEFIAPAGVEFRGSDGVVGFTQALFEGTPDVQWTVTNRVEAGDTVVFESLFEGTHTGTLRTPDGQEIPPTNRRVMGRVCDVSRVRDGQVVSAHIYQDLLSYMQQLGVVG